MDFWAQHKDFVLKVLAGFGIFLVVLIARGVTYGDELETAKSQNARLSSKIRKLEIAPISRIVATETAVKQLTKSVRTIANQIGWDASDESLELKLIERGLGYTRRFAPLSAEERMTEARGYLGAIRDNLNGGFGQLRLLLREELVEEAAELNIEFDEGIGFQNLLSVQETELLQYLLQLELTARLARYAIDARVDGVDGMRITTGGVRESIPGANPEFLREYEVKIQFRGPQAAVTSLLNRLDEDTPRVGVRFIRADRLTRPPNHVQVELEVVATATNPEVSFAKPAEVEKTE